MLIKRSTDRERGGGGGGGGLGNERTVGLRFVSKK